MILRTPASVCSTAHQSKESTMEYVIVFAVIAVIFILVARTNKKGKGTFDKGDINSSKK